VISNLIKFESNFLFLSLLPISIFKAAISLNMWTFLLPFLIVLMGVLGLDWEWLFHR
jgi:hypothetical protein